MSRHEWIKMFELVMRALLFIVWKVSNDDRYYTELNTDYEKFIKELEFKK